MTRTRAKAAVGRPDWSQLQAAVLECEPPGIRIDLSRLSVADDGLAGMDRRLRAALRAMAALEAGGIANPDERRMVGHYWLRDPRRAPTAAITRAIRECVARVKRFAGDVHAGRERPPRAPRFRQLLLIGIGGSALGPQFVARALGAPETDRLRPLYLDNTDPDGFDRVLAELHGRLPETLTVVVSKSGSTPETRNGMLEVRRAYEAAGLTFGPHAIAVTQTSSLLDREAVAGCWRARFPMWDWVGGRTSVLSAVGLVPLALQGVDIEGLLAGARGMDALTRDPAWRENPAARLALAWYHAGGGRGKRAMVILPYKDRLELLSRYLQQLVMESLGKERDLSGRVVHQGLTVYGNKGSTDQHAYVQQLRDGPADFFATFLAVLRDRQGASIEVEPGVTSGDYLHGLLHGTRQALWENGRESITITLPEVSPATVGALIALFERAVGLYASLIGINAYHQPGVEAGKRAAARVLERQRAIVAHLRAEAPRALTVKELAAAMGLAEDAETIFTVLEHLAANPDRGIQRLRSAGSGLFEARYAVVRTAGASMDDARRPAASRRPSSLRPAATRTDARGTVQRRSARRARR